MANHSRPIILSPDDRRELQRLQRSSSVPAGLSRRARAVLLIADHISGAEVARRTGYTQVQISRIRRRFVESGLAGLPDQPRSGRPRRLKPRKTAQVVAMTLKPPPAGVTHWSSRDSVCGPGSGHRHRRGRVFRPPHGKRFPALYQTAGAALPQTGLARHCRQLLDSYHSGRQSLAHEASPRAVSLHSQGSLLAQHGRSLVQHPHPQVGSPGLVRFGRRPDPTHPQLHQSLESQPHTLRVDSATGRYRCQGRAS